MGALSGFLTALNVAGNVANTVGTIAGAAKTLPERLADGDKQATAKAAAAAQAKAADTQRAGAKQEQTFSK